MAGDLAASGGGGPCCINGHLMRACGLKPAYDHYSDPAYQAVTDEVAKTLADELPQDDFYVKNSAATPFQIESWNDQVLFDQFPEDDDGYYDAQGAAEREAEVLRVTAERLRKESA